jgi:ankyrin repeat protein
MDVCQKLVEAGADVNRKGHWNKTPLQTAVQNPGNLQVVEYLYSKGADYGVLDAASVNDATHVRALVKKDPAQIDAADPSLGTVLTLAVNRGNADLVEFLLKAGADIEGRDPQRNTPLHLAALSGNEKLAASLLAHRAVLEATNAKGIRRY